MNRSLIRRATVPVLALLLASTSPAAAVADSFTTPAMPAAAVPAGPPQPATTAISKEKALAIFTSYFGQVKGPGTVTPMLSMYGDRQVWDLQYMVRQGSSSWGTNFASVDAATGQVLSYHTYPPMTRTPRTGPLTGAYPETLARSWAWALVRDLYPEYAPQLAPAPDFLKGWPSATTNTYSFMWTLTHEGVPLGTRYIRVQVEKDTLDYVGLEQTLLAPVSYTGGPVTVTPEKALATFASIEPQLSYQISSTSPGGKPDVKLLYTWAPYPIAADSGKVMNEGPLTAKPEPLPPAAAPAEPALNLPLTPEQAIALVRNALGLPASVEGRVASVPRPLGNSNADTIDIQLNGPGGYYGNASVDLKIGRLLSASGPGYQPDPLQEPPATPTAEQKAKAKAAAIQLIQRFYPDLSTQVRVVDRPYYMGSSPVAAFNFVRYQGDVPVPSNQIIVVIDYVTLRLESLYTYWQDDLTFPDASKAISPAEALKIFLKGRTPQLVWLEDVGDSPQPRPYPPYNPTRPDTVRLAYSLPPAEGIPLSSVDALTGRPMDLGGQAVQSKVNVDQVLTGHWAEGELRYLLDLGVLTPDKLNPDAPITRGDALQLLQRGRKFPQGDSYDMSATMPYSDVKPDSPLYSIVQGALADRVLVPQEESLTFDADRQMTRAQFAVWVARSLGLGKLARSGFKSPAPAETTFPEQRNAIAFLEALGILSGGDYNAALTQADVAAVVVRVIIYTQQP